MPIDDSGDLRILRLEADGPVISTADEASDLAGNAWMDHAEIIVLPVARIDPEFFRLESQFAGEFVQKLVNYQVKLAVLGDITEFVARSRAFRDFVWESNRAEHVWFFPDEAALSAKLASRA